MQYIEYIRLAVVILTFIKEFRSAKNAGETVDHGSFLKMLGQIGETAKIKELQGEEMQLLAPEFLKLIDTLKGLRD